jgi:hypothetical protein
MAALGELALIFKSYAVQIGTFLEIYAKYFVGDITRSFTFPRANIILVADSPWIVH